MEDIAGLFERMPGHRAVIASGSGSKVGGYPYPVQNDPRFRFPDRCPTLLVQLDAELTMWGDAGAAQLFGDPAAVGRGDLSSLWWDWACA